MAIEKLDRQSSIAFHTQLSLELEQQIMSAKLRPGDKLPSERDLAVLYGVSRITVQSAIETLVRKGLISRAVGRGTFVSSPVNSSRASAKGNIGYVLNVHAQARDAVDGRDWERAFARSVQVEVQRRSNHLFVSVIDDERPDDMASFKAMLQKIDGLVIREAPSLVLAECANRAGVPVVMMLPTVDAARFDTVRLDHRGVGAEACRYLMELGHRRIGHLRGQAGTAAGDDRRNGFFSFAAAHRLALDPSWEAGGLDWFPETGEAAFRLIVERHPDVTALFACNDSLAHGAARAARSMGRRIPDDLSIVACDSIPLAPPHDPPLTTFSLHEPYIIETAVACLFDRIRAPDRPRVETTLTSAMVVRESCRRMVPQAERG